MKTGLLASALLLIGTIVPSARTQPAGKVPRIGFLAAPSQGFFSTRLSEFYQGLRDLGYLDAKNIQIEYRYADGKLDRLPSLANELVKLKVSIIVASGPAALAAKNATKTIPIVFAAFQDPIGTGLVESLAMPGGNVTGLSTLAPELSGKRLEMLKEALPTVKRLVFLSAAAASAKETQAAAQALGLQLQSVLVRDSTTSEALLKVAIKNRPQGLITSPGVLFNTQQTRILDFAARYRLSAMYTAPEFVDAGGLMFYAANQTEQFRRAATYMDKILKGARPTELPVEQPMKFEFVIKLKAAKQIGLTIPPNVLARVDRVIR